MVVLYCLRRRKTKKKKEGLERELMRRDLMLKVLAFEGRILVLRRERRR